MSISDLTLPAADFRKVLVVDDEPAMHAMFDLFLKPDTDPDAEDPYALPPTVEELAQTRNFQVIHAQDGNNAVSIAREAKRRNRAIQVAFVDLKMANIDGIETIRQLQEVDPRIIFNVVTGFPDEAYEQIAEHLGLVPVEVIPKPFGAESIYGGAVRMCSRWEQIHGF